MHGRRHFVDVVDDFRDECGYVLQALKVVYKNDAATRKQQLSPEARLLFHQTQQFPAERIGLGNCGENAASIAGGSWC